MEQGFDRQPEKSLDLWPVGCNIVRFDDFWQDSLGSAVIFCCFPPGSVSAAGVVVVRLFNRDE
jgi:hypothetical protein